LNDCVAMRYVARSGRLQLSAFGYHPVVEMAWTWLRYLSDSALTQWFNQRTQGTGPNRRARRLGIALWRYLKASNARTRRLPCLLMP